MSKVFVCLFFVVFLLFGCTQMSNSDPLVLCRFDFHEGFQGETVSACADGKTLFSDKPLFSDPATDIAFSVEKNLKGPVFELQVVVNGNAFSFDVEICAGRFFRIYFDENEIRYEQSQHEIFYD